MSAAEIIALIEKLPPEEKAEVIAFARTLEVDERKVRTISEATFNEVVPRVFAKHHELLRKLAQ